MATTKKARFWTAITMAMILGAIIVMPLRAEATLLDPYGDSSLLVDVSITPGNVYSYKISNPDGKLFFMSVGTVDPLTLAPYGVVGVTANTPATSTLTDNSLQLFFFSGLIAGAYDFLISYASFVDDQYITFQKTGGKAKTIEAEYSASAPVPEPATLLLLGSGIAGIGFLSRRKRKN